VHDPSRLKLDSIVTVLYERPGLKLELTGYVDEQQDREKLKDRMFDHKIKTQKRLALIQDGLSPAPVEQIQVNADEYPVYLQHLSEAATLGPKQKDQYAAGRVELSLQ